jgi:hypothetical protein
MPTTQNNLSGPPLREPLLQQMDNDWSIPLDQSGTKATPGALSKSWLGWYQSATNAINILIANGGNVDITFFQKYL